MGCGGSRLVGVAAEKAHEGGVVPIPEGLRPLLRRRLEEMKKRSHLGVLKGNQTLSKKELLLQHGTSEDGEETEENDGSLKSSSKVAPAPDNHVEEKKEVIYENFFPREDAKEVEVVKKQEEMTSHDDEVGDGNAKKEGDDDKGINLDDEDISVKNEGDDDHDDNQGRMSNFDERMICPASPSFRVYCVDVASSSDDEAEVDGEDARKSMETESVTVEPKEEESSAKKEKRERKGKRFGIALPRKYLANVTAPCYAGGGGCMGNTHSRLVQEKSSQ